MQRRTEEVARIRELLGLRGGEHLLDVGGGSGRFTTSFATNCAQVTILEPNLRRVTRGRKRVSRIRFEVGRGESIPSAVSSFDRVTAIRSTHHMESADQFLGEALRVLRPGGFLLLEELRPTSWFAQRIGRWLHSGHEGHLDFRGPTEWTEAMNRAGFSGTRSVVGRRWFFVVGAKPTSSSA